MRKKILKVFFVILTGITVTLTGCELSGSNESAQTESESGKDAVKFIPNLTTAVTRKPRKIRNVSGKCINLLDQSSEPGSIRKT